MYPMEKWKKDGVARHQTPVGKAAGSSGGEVIVRRKYMPAGLGCISKLAKL
jgi:hypothetical protein